jgi:hypothetical protein
MVRRKFFSSRSDILPELLHLLGGAAVGIDLHHRAAVDHRGGIIGAVVEGDGGDGAVLRECDRGLVGDPRLGGGSVDDEDERLAGALAQVDGGADGAKVVRARPGRDEDQLGDLDDALDRHGDGGGRIDHRELEALLAQYLEVGLEPGDRGLGESGHFGLAFVPPVGERALRVDVDQADGSRTRPFRLDGEMAGQGRLAGSPLLRR